jgi:hypothetical protein
MIYFFPLLYAWYVPTLAYLLHFPTVYLLPTFTIRVRHYLESLSGKFFSLPQ